MDMKVRFWIWLWLAPLAGAQPVSSLVEEALRNNREILTAQKKVEALRQRPAHESSLPDPTVGLGWASNGPPWPGAGLGVNPTSNLGVMVSQEVPAPGKLKLRGEIADEEAAAAFNEYLATRLKVVSHLKQAYHEMHHAAVAIGFVDRYQELLNDMLRISEARYAVGRGAQQDILRGQTQLAIFATQRVRFEQEREAKQIEIDALLNRPQGGRIEVPADMTAGPMPAPLEDMLAQARANSPVVERDKEAVKGSELSASLARKDYAPDYTVSGGYFNQGGMPPMWQARVDFKLPAYFWRKQRAAVNQQEASASQARHEYAETLVEVEAGIREQYSVAEASRKLMDLYEKSVIPEARLAYESALAGYQAGRGDFISLFTSFTSVVDYELMDHEEIMRFHVALAKLEELTGVEQ
jgi:cobalt-zinc-cadmium efflux system outer membrane protein